MATFTASSVNKVPITLSQAGQVVMAEGEYEVTTALAADDIVALCHLPAGHKPIDFMLQADDLDSDGTPTITLTVAVLNDDSDDIVASTNFLTASTVAQAGGVARADVVLGLQLAASDTDRVVGVKVAAAAETAVAGTIKGILTYSAV